MDLVNFNNEMQNIKLKFNWTYTVDAIDLATSIISFSKMVEIASDNFITEAQRLRVWVCGFQQWSLETIFQFAIENINDIIWESWIAIWWIASHVITQNISQIIDSVAWAIDIYKFVKWDRFTAEPDHSWVKITNNCWQVHIYTWPVYNLYKDPTFQWHSKRLIEPLINNDQISSLSIVDENNDIINEVDKEEAIFFNIQQKSIESEVNIVCKVYEANMFTFNWKITIQKEKCSISFKKIKSDYSQTAILIDAMKNWSLVSITWKATINEEWWYENIVIESVRKTQTDVFSNN